MKNLIITESEKSRILNMHKSRSSRHYLMEQQVYVVKRGDTLSKIASENETTVQDLMDMNPDIESADLIYPGQEIILSKNEMTDVPNTEFIKGRDITKIKAAMDDIFSAGMQDRMKPISGPDIFKTKKDILLAAAEDMLDSGEISQEDYDYIVGDIDIDKPFDNEGVKKLESRLKEFK